MYGVCVWWVVMVGRMVLARDGVLVYGLGVAVK